MKIAMSGMKNTLEEISSLLDIAEEKTGTFGKLVMETIQNEIRIEKKGILHILTHLILIKY